MDAGRSADRLPVVPVSARTVWQFFWPCSECAKVTFREQALT